MIVLCHCCVSDLSLVDVHLWISFTRRSICLQNEFEHLKIVEKWPMIFWAANNRQGYSYRVTSLHIMRNGWVGPYNPVYVQLSLGGNHCRFLIMNFLSLIATPPSSKTMVLQEVDMYSRAEMTAAFAVPSDRSADVYHRGMPPTHMNIILPLSTLDSILDDTTLSFFVY